MKKALPAVAAAALWLAGAPALAADWEAAVWAGPTFPGFEQSFEFDPGSVTIPGVVVDEAGVFRMDGSGGIAFGGSLAFHPVPIFGIEARIDTADVDVATSGASYDLSANIPPFGPVRATVAFTEGEGDLERLTPVSLNLRLRAPGTLGLFVSGGVSYLPGFRFAIRQPVEFALGDGPLIPVGEVILPAEALPEAEGEGRWGWNAGGGVQVRVAPRVRLMAEGRYFWFQSQTLFWGEPAGSGALGGVAGNIVGPIVRQIAGELEPVQFNPAYWQAAAGVALSF